MADTEAIFIGGPRDGTTAPAPESAMVEVTEGGLTHRYERTGATREQNGRSYRVYNYDGEVRSSAQAQPVKPPDGQPGSGT